MRIRAASRYAFIRLSCYRVVNRPAIYLALAKRSLAKTIATQHVAVTSRPSTDERGTSMASEPVRCHWPTSVSPDSPRDRTTPKHLLRVPVKEPQLLADVPDRFDSVQHTRSFDQVFLRSTTSNSGGCTTSAKLFVATVRLIDS